MTSLPALWFAIDIVLAGYVVWEVVRFGPQYRQLKLDLVNGDMQARARLYRKAIRFEWGSALLALLALGFDWNQLSPKILAFENNHLLQVLRGSDLDRGSMAGIFLGLLLGTAGFVIARIRSNRRGVAPGSVPARRWRKLLPDFFALVPVSPHERLLWIVVAISAGVCEEIVFRGWLLSTMHGVLHLQGATLLLVAAILFGLAHSYQGVSGMLLTAFAGALFCGLYVATGSLLMPILLHILIDVRFAVLPAPRTQEPRTILA
jgi:membrane protease YdiL (CAAX protease family)